MQLQPPVRVGRYEPVILDGVVRWGPVSVITARPARARIIVEEAMGVRFPSTEPRC